MRFPGGSYAAPDLPGKARPGLFMCGAGMDFRVEARCRIPPDGHALRMMSVASLQIRHLRALAPWGRHGLR